MSGGVEIPTSNEPVGPEARYDSGLLWGVGAVAIRLGLATPTLRTWERRYGIGPSSRTAGGHRRYSEDDIDRVQLMQTLIGAGVPAQSAARVAVGLDPTEIEAALAAPVPGGAGGSRPPRPTSSPPVAVASILRAAKDLDVRALDDVFGQVLDDLGVLEGWADVLVPALRAIGEQWAEGTSGVECEHLASGRLAAQLSRRLRGRMPRPASRPVLLCGAEDDEHGLALLALEAVLGAEDIESRCLGSRTPVVALDAAVAQTDPAAIFVWASLERASDDETLARAAAAGVPVLLGGPGWPDDLPAGVARCEDLASAVRLIRDEVS